MIVPVLIHSNMPLKWKPWGGIRLYLTYTPYG
jgi:hypothetical protein